MDQDKLLFSSPSATQGAIPRVQLKTTGKHPCQLSASADVPAGFGEEEPLLISCPQGLSDASLCAVETGKCGFQAVHSAWENSGRRGWHQVKLIWFPLQFSRSRSFLQ